jgi:hypothetical protein
VEIQSIFETYIFIDLLEESPLWRVNSLRSALPLDQTDLHDKRYLYLTNTKLTKMTRKIKEIFASRYI